MNRPLDTATAGLLRSQSSVAQSANRIAQAANPQRETFDASVRRGATQAPRSHIAPGTKPASNSNGISGTQTARGSAAFVSAGGYLPSLAEETVQMRIAAQTYSANARLLQTADEFLAIAEDAFAGGTVQDDADT